MPLGELRRGRESRGSNPNECACPSKPHPRPLSRGERGDLGDGKWRTGALEMGRGFQDSDQNGFAVVAISRLKVPATLLQGNPAATKSPLSPRERGRG